MPRTSEAQVRALGKHVTSSCPSSEGCPATYTVYDDRTWILSAGGQVNAPMTPVQISVAPQTASGDKADRACLQRIAGNAFVRPTSGRYHKSCDQAEAWLQALMRCRRDGKSFRNDWVAAAEFQSDNMLGLLLSLRYSRRKENRDRFRLMCENYAVQCAVQLAPLVSDALFDGSLWSGVYQYFSYTQKSVYHGKFHGSESWSCWDRAKQHYGATKLADKGDTEVQNMYRTMARKGGCESWLLLPVLRMPTIPKSQLDAIEQVYIKADSHCLNTQHKRKGAAEGSVRQLMPDRVIDLRQNAGPKTRSQTKASQHPVAIPKHLKAKRG